MRRWWEEEERRPDRRLQSPLWLSTQQPWTGREEGVGVRGQHRREEWKEGGQSEGKQGGGRTPGRWERWRGRRRRRRKAGDEGVWREGAGEELGVGRAVAAPPPPSPPRTPAPPPTPSAPHTAASSAEPLTGPSTADAFSCPPPLHLRPMWMRSVALPSVRAPPLPFAAVVAPPSTSCAALRGLVASLR